MAVVFSNNATTVLSSNITNSATSIAVQDGSVFPTLSGTDYFYATLQDPGNTKREIVKVTARSGNTLTVTRAVDGSSASAFSANDAFELRLNAAALNDAVNSGTADLELNSFTGDGSEVDFTLSMEALEANTLVYIDGVYQNKTAYSISGYVLTFSAAPDNGAAIEVTTATVAPIQESTDFLLNQFTGDGSDTTFTLSSSPEENQTTVFISGVYQSKSNYSISGTTLTFSTAPPASSSIEVMVARTVVYGIGTPSNDTVSTAKIVDGAVTPAKLSLTYATETFVGTAVSNLVDSSPAALDTLNELAAALGDDPNFATTVTNSIALKAPLASPSFTGNVSIGNTVASSMDGGANNLVIGSGSGTEGMTIYSGTSNSGTIYFADGASGDDRFRGQINYAHSDNSLNFRTNASSSPQMTLDSSGNLLVVKSAMGSNTVGFQVASNGKIAATVSGAETARFNRTTSDGDIVQFRKDDTTVGSIGTASNDLNIDGGASHSGIRFQAGSLLPRLNGADTDGTIDLGYDDGSATHRFKDLYLSGAVNAGSVVQTTSSTGLAGDFTNTNTSGYGLRVTTYGTGAQYGFAVDSYGGGYSRDFTVGADGNVNVLTGNLLVGKTSTDNTTAGTRIHPAGYASFTIANDYPIIANRLSSDGDIAVFRKNGTTVGSIGTNAATMYVSAPQAGGMKYSYYNSTNAVMLPVTTTGANADATHDLGYGSSRFRDLYLSGGVYLGGTGAANKLDDYEEGSFNLGIQVGTLGATSKGKYTKIGNQVTVFCQVDSGTDYSNVNTLTLTGLPFTAISPHTTGHAGNGAVSYTANMGSDVISAVAGSGGTTVFFSRINSDTLTHANCIGIWSVRFTLTYQTA